MAGTAQRLLEIAREIVASTPDFHKVRGAGDGDHATNSFMRELRARAEGEFGSDYSEKRLCGASAFAVDFYFPEERTIVEIALGLPNPASEFEKDILKALVAKEHGSAVERLLFISRPGAIRRCQQPGRTLLSEWAAAKHGLRIEVEELGVEARPPRRRTGRRQRGAATSSTPAVV